MQCQATAFVFLNANLTVGKVNNFKTSGLKTLEARQHSQLNIEKKNTG